MCRRPLLSVRVRAESNEPFTITPIHDPTLRKGTSQISEIGNFRFEFESAFDESSRLVFADVPVEPDGWFSLKT